MRAKPEVEKVQSYGLNQIWGSSKGDKSLSKLSSSGNKGVIKAFLDMGVTDDILVAMNEFKSSRRTNKLAVGAIWALAIDSESTIQLLEAGVVKHIVEVIHLFTSDASIVKHAVGGLQSFSVEREARQVLMDWKATDAVTKAMNRHLSSHKIQYYSLKYLSNCWIKKGGVVEVPERQIQLVVQAMLKYQVQDITKAGCLALQNGTNNSKNTAILCECDGIQELRAVLQEAQSWSKEAAKVLQRMDGKVRKASGNARHSRISLSTLSTLEETAELETEQKFPAMDTVSTGRKKDNPNENKTYPPGISAVDDITMLMQKVAVGPTASRKSVGRVKEKYEELKQMGMNNSSSSCETSPVIIPDHSED